VLKLINSTPTHFDFAIGFLTRTIQQHNPTFLQCTSFPIPNFFLKSKCVQQIIFIKKPNSNCLRSTIFRIQTVSIKNYSIVIKLS
jgi:hypothetical protein